MIDQLRAALAGPHGAADVILFAVAGAALVLALSHLVRPTPRGRRWSRLEAAAFPAATAWTLFVAAIVVHLREDALHIGMFLRMAGFWAMVITAPLAVGQVVQLRPPAWLRRTHVALAAAFLLLLAISDLAFTRTAGFEPARQFGPLSVAFLLPTAALAGWWLLACLERIETRSGLAIFAVGASGTVLALLAASLVVDPGLADHFLAVGFLPLLVGAEFVALQQLILHRPAQ